MISRRCFHRKSSRQQVHRPCRGLSLLEIIVALAVLTGTAALLAQMVSLGVKHAECSREITEAQTVAHNLLNELLADLRPWDASASLQPVDAWSDWDYVLQVEPVGVGDLVAVTVTVARRTEEDASSTSSPVESSDQALVTSPRQYHLTRWVTRPQLVENSVSGLDQDAGFDRPQQPSPLPGAPPAAASRFGGP